MNPVENLRTTAQEVLSLARQKGIDLDSSCTDGHFSRNRRWIYLWRKDALPSSGPANEPLGTLHYNMQGRIAVLPNRLKESASLFHEAWHETGTFENIEQAFALVKAWLLDGKEVDELPERRTRAYGIL